MDEQALQMQAMVAEPVDPLEAMRLPVTNLLEQYVDGELTPEKTRRYLMLRKSHNYNEGQQFNSLTVDTLTGGIDYSPIGTPFSPNMEQAEGIGLYDYNIDITKSYGRKYSAILGTRTWYNCNAVGKNPTSEKDRKAARSANILRDWFTSCWKLPTLNLEYFARQWDSGEVYGYLQWESDARTFGKVDVPQYAPKTVTLEPGGYACPNCGGKSEQPQTVDALDEMGQPTQQTVCPSCGGELADFHYQEPMTTQVPEYVGTATFPQAGPKVTLCTGMTVTIPQDTRSLRDAPWLLYEYEEHRGVLLEFFGEKLRKLVEEGSGNVKGGKSAAGSAIAVQSRQAQYTMTGQAMPAIQNRWTFSRYWLRPAMYEYVKKEEREMLKQRFPDGVKVSLVDGVIVDMVGEDLGDVWTVGVPESGKSLIHKPICWGILGHQDIINDFYQIMIANLERGLPSFIFDPEVIDRDALSRKSYLPAEAVPAKRSAGNLIEKSIAKLPTASFPDQAPVIASAVETNVQLHTGLLPTAWGGGEKASTAEESRNRLNQALQQLSIHGVFAGQFWMDVFMLAVQMTAKNAAGDFSVSVSGKNGLTTSEIVDIQALQDGQYEFQAEVGIPMTFAERKDQLNQIITQNPDLAKAMQLDSRTNLPIVRDALLTGMSELQVFGEDEWQNTLEKIQQLIEEQPMQGPDGSQQPSQQPEEFVTNYATEADNVRQWLLSEQGRQAKREKPMGWRNVVLYGLLCSNLANPPMPAGMPPQNGQPPAQGEQGGTPPPSGGGNPPPEQTPEQIGV